MEKDRYDSAISLFSLMAHPARLQILDILRRGEACVCHLQAALGLPQPYISQQLRVLREAGVLTSRRNGLFVYYQLTDERVVHLLEDVLGPAGGEDVLSTCTCPRCQGESPGDSIPADFPNPRETIGRSGR